MCHRRDLRRLTHGSNFLATLIKSHVVQDMCQRDKFVRRIHPGARLVSDFIHPTQNTLIKNRIIAHGVKNAFSIFEQIGQDIVHIFDRKSVICTINIASSFQASTFAIPDFLVWITLPAKQNIFAMSSVRNNNCNRLRFWIAGHIIKITIRTKRKFNIVIPEMY